MGPSEQREVFGDTLATVRARLWVPWPLTSVTSLVADLSYDLFAASEERASHAILYEKDLTELSKRAISLKTLKIVLLAEKG